MKLSNPKKNILLFFTAPLIVALVFVLLVAALDPFALLHQRGIKIGVLNNLRVQSAGAIHSTNFDSIILGTSILENTSATSASEIVGGKFINLSVSGSTFYERRFILDYALKSKSLKNVIYSMDAVYTNPVYEIADYPASRYSFLYNDSKLDNIRAYFDFSLAGCIIKDKFGSSCMGNDYEFDRPNAWMNLPEHSERFGGLQNWLQAENNHQITEALSTIARDIKKIQKSEKQSFTDAQIDKAIQVAIDYIDRDIIRYVRQYPDTEFNLVFPPYSRIVFAQWYQLGHIDVPVHKAVLRHLAQLADDLPNLHIYAYEDMDFLDDIANYKDTVHFHPDYNDMILKSVANGTHQITLDNVDTYLETAKHKAERYDLVSIGRTIDAYLNEKR